MLQPCRPLRNLPRDETTHLLAAKTIISPVFHMRSTGKCLPRSHCRTQKMLLHLHGSASTSNWGYCLGSGNRRQQSAHTRDKNDNTVFTGRTAAIESLLRSAINTETQCKLTHDPNAVSHVIPQLQPTFQHIDISQDIVLRLL